MSDIVDFIFGGTDTSAQQAQIAANRAASKEIGERAAQAREDALRLFPRADLSRNLGFQAALDVLGQTIPQQAQAFQGGNVAAQQRLLGGQPQFQSAILGGPVSLGGPTTLAFDPSFAQQQLFGTSLPDALQGLTGITQPPTGQAPGQIPGQQAVPGQATLPGFTGIDPGDLAGITGGSGDFDISFNPRGMFATDPRTTAGSLLGGLAFGLPGSFFGGLLGAGSDISSQQGKFAGSNEDLSGLSALKGALAALSFGAFGQPVSEQIIDVIETNPATVAQAALEEQIGLDVFGPTGGLDAFGGLGGFSGEEASFGVGSGFAEF